MRTERSERSGGIEMHRAHFQLVGYRQCVEVPLPLVIESPSQSSTVPPICPNSHNLIISCDRDFSDCHLDDFLSKPHPSNRKYLTCFTAIARFVAPRSCPSLPEQPVLQLESSHLQALCSPLDIEQACLLYQNVLRPHIRQQDGTTLRALF